MRAQGPGTYTVYGVSHISGSVIYVGCTRNDPRARFLCLTSKGGAINDYFGDNIECLSIIRLGTFDNAKDAAEMEQAMYREHRPPCNGDKCTPYIALAPPKPASLNPRPVRDPSIPKEYDGIDLSDDPDTGIVRERINAKMAGKKLSYGDIAKRCGLARTTVFRFLNGADARGATLDKLKKA